MSQSNINIIAGILSGLFIGFLLSVTGIGKLYLQVNSRLFQNYYLVPVIIGTIIALLDNSSYKR